MHYVKHFNICDVDTKQVACIELHGKPNAATEGAVGVLGIDVDSPLHETYKCVAVNGSIYTWVELVGEPEINEDELNAMLDELLSESFNVKLSVTAVSIAYDYRAIYTNTAGEEVTVVLNDYLTEDNCDLYGEQTPTPAHITLPNVNSDITFTNTSGDNRIVVNGEVLVDYEFWCDTFTVPFDKLTSGCTIEVHFYYA